MQKRLLLACLFKIYMLIFLNGCQRSPVVMVLFVMQQEQSSFTLLRDSGRSGCSTSVQPKHLNIVPPREEIEPFLSEVWQQVPLFPYSKCLRG